MALSITFIGSQRTGASIVQDFWLFTASGSGDTLSVTISGIPLACEFFNPSTTSSGSGGAGQITSSQPTFGAWAAGTVSGTSTATLTANANGVVTNGTMVITHTGM